MSSGVKQLRKTQVFPRTTFDKYHEWVNADSSVNVDNAKEIGEKILASMTGRSPSDHTFKKVDQAKTLASMSTVKIDSERAIVWPPMLV